MEAASFPNADTEWPMHVAVCQWLQLTSKLGSFSWSCIGSNSMQSDLPILQLGISRATYSKWTATLPSQWLPLYSTHSRARTHRGSGMCAGIPVWIRHKKYASCLTIRQSRGEKKVNSKMNTPGEPLVQEMNPTKCEIAPRRFVTKRGSFEQQRQCMSLCAHKKETNRRVIVVQIHLSLVKSNETVLQNS